MYKYNVSLEQFVSFVPFIYHQQICHFANVA